jgi:hypothetical protein
MTTKRIPISVAKRVSEEYGMNQVIIVTWDDINKVTHVVTYGKSVEECIQAAQGGNFVKKALGWPEELCKDMPARAKRKKNEKV